MAQSKAERAYEILRERIMDGTYGPGQRLVIDQLGREHQISSGPWRESLRRLEAEGWVEIVPNAGAVVSSFDTDAWQRSMRLLARLEGLATALSAPHLSSDDILSARQMNQEMRDALANLDLGGFGTMNRDFHVFLSSRCQDPRLFRLVEEEWARMEFVRRAAFFYAPGRALASLTEHDSILDLIEGGADPEMIETATRRHEVNTLKAVREHEAGLEHGSRRSFGR